MEIILLQDIPKVGDKHEIVTVAKGYGLNYLLPQGMAISANKANRGKLSGIVKREEAREMKMLGDYQILADKIKGASLRIGAKAGTSGKIFGSVTNVQLADALKNQLGVEVERKKIHLNGEIKEVGEHSARVIFHKTVEATINFEVVAE
jgi:large subunit ribosomal protein L9